MNACREGEAEAVRWCVVHHAPMFGNAIVCPLAGSPRSDAVLDLPATFPLDVAAFTAGLDSPNHSSESRKAWIALFFRDMKRFAALPSPRSDDREGTPNG